MLFPNLIIIKVLNNLLSNFEYLKRVYNSEQSVFHIVPPSLIYIMFILQRHEFILLLKFIFHNVLSFKLSKCRIYLKKQDRRQEITTPCNMFISCCQRMHQRFTPNSFSSIPNLDHQLGHLKISDSKFLVFYGFQLGFWSTKTYENK